MRAFPPEATAEGARAALEHAEITPTPALVNALVDYASGLQMEERGFWMARDIAQTGNNRNLCAQLDEFSANVRDHNAGIPR